jgi:hypothetical protein
MNMRPYFENSEVAVEFKPLKVLRRLIDYYNRREVIRQLKNTPAKKIDFFKIVLIELKQKMYHMVNFCYSKFDYPKYKGKMYSNRYVLPSHEMMARKEGDKANSDIAIYKIPTYMVCHHLEHPIVKSIIDNLNKGKVPNQTYWENNKSLILEKLKKDFYNPEKTQLSLLPYLIKVKAHIGTMDYAKIRRPYSCPLNIKKYNHTTGKTSNRGLKAVDYDTYSYVKGWCIYRQWAFGGITCDDIEKLCVENGLKKIKGKKYQYGDYAKFYMSL